MSNYRLLVTRRHCCGLAAKAKSCAKSVKHNKAEKVLQTLHHISRGVYPLVEVESDGALLLVVKSLKCC